MTAQVPAGQLAGVVLLAVVTGLVAGAVPARRAARLDVLRAVAAD
jgi:putative ABC transport system permease protein